VVDSTPPADSTPRAADSAPHAADLELARACGLGDARAIAEFERRFLPMIPAFLARTPWASAADEVQQLLRERLFVAVPPRRPKIDEYSGRGPLAGWLRVVAIRTASNASRGVRAGAELDESAPEAVVALDPELSLVRARAGAAMREALRDAFAALTPEERMLVRWSFADGLGVDRIAPMLGVHRATAARRLAAARDRLHDLTMRLLRERLRLHPRDLESLFRAGRSHLEMSLSSLLREPCA
jgi:RNA polymerase sigma-70 factor (ECF subfamily)